MSVLDNYQCEGQLSIFDLFDQDIWSGKTSAEPSVQTKEKTSDVSLKKRSGSSKKMPLFLDLRGGAKWSPSGAILGDGWSVAWRVHDAQFWGVPQRRKRIALVADFAGESAPEILFERESVPGDIESGGETGQTTSRPASGDADSSSYTLKIRGGCERDSSGKKAGKGALVQTELSGTLGVSQDQTLITSKVYGISGYESNSMRSANPHSGIYEADSTRTLDLNAGNPACNQGGMVVLDGLNQTVSDVSPTLTMQRTDTKNVPMICIEGNGSRESHKGDGYKESDKSYTLNTVEQHAVCYGFDRASFNQGKNAKYDFSVEEEKAQTLVSKGPGGVLAKP